MALFHIIYLFTACINYYGATARRTEALHLLTLSILTHSIMTLGIATLALPSYSNQKRSSECCNLAHYAERRNDKCRCDECRGAIFTEIAASASVASGFQ
jgi:hypothetical protein